ncbi:hypothetical protein ACFPOH_10920, partial [Ureibacillus suwonensis]
MTKRIPNVDWANRLENAIRRFVKEKFELIMRKEIKHFCKFSHYFRLTFSNYFGSFSEIMCNFFADYFRFCDFPQVLCTF